MCNDESSGSTDDGPSEKLLKEEMQKRHSSDESFSDFVQYDVNEHPSDIVRPCTLMQACVESFQALFHTIVGVHILKNTLLPCIALEQLCGAGGSPGSSSETNQIAVGDMSGDVCKVFECACQLLVSFSSFPMYCVDQARVARRSSSHGKPNVFTNSL